ncbi:MAG TPA: BPSS1780 family membrane protein [Aromatoleum sp.]|uniref:DUF2189 domain-containing protein n=1 Tax=Aromatoleum sp. TaxID=2307007 RepID=UPI002B47FB44|nr:BPSS1780 family membrane protein [Aromatoleum sp.]HJV28426.1 BPSS1780 family membrane protein [Aromatoleum sp.]
MTETSNASANHHRRRHPLPHPGHVTPAQTLQWLAAGWKTFAASPGLWILQTLALTAILFTLAFVIGVIPTYGPLLAPLVLQMLFPMLVAGMISGAHALDQGQPLQFAYLFDGARRHPGNLLMIGFFCVLGGLLAALIAIVVGSSAAVTGVIVGSLGNIGLGSSVALLSLALWPVFLVLLLMALWFAPTLVMLQNVSPLDAIRLSLRAGVSNLASFIVLGFILYLLAWFAMLPFGLGVLVLIPVLAGALHAAWKDTFGESQPALLAPAADSRSTPDDAA